MTPAQQLVAVLPSVSLELAQRLLDKERGSVEQAVQLHQDGCEWCIAASPSIADLRIPAPPSSFRDVVVGGKLESVLSFIGGGGAREDTDWERDLAVALLVKTKGDVERAVTVHCESLEWATCVLKAGHLRDHALAAGRISASNHSRFRVAMMILESRVRARTTLRRHDGDGAAVTVRPPRNWLKRSGAGVRVVPLRIECEEAAGIVSHWLAAVNGAARGAFRVLYVLRIENPTMYQAFWAAPTDSVVACFHGTGPEAAESIARGGFKSNGMIWTATNPCISLGYHTSKVSAWLSPVPVPETSIIGQLVREARALCPHSAVMLKCRALGGRAHRAQSEVLTFTDPSAIIPEHVIIYARA